MKQIPFSQQKQIDSQLKASLNPPKEFGGSLIVGKRKSKRPLNIKLPIHTVLRCSTLRSGSLLWNANEISAILEKFARKFNVIVYEKAIVSNHIHAILKFSSRKSYNAFVRAFAGVLAQTFKVIWSARPWTRILNWGRDFRIACAYTIQNALEAVGKVPYKKRKAYRIKPSQLPNTKELNKKIT